MVCWKEQLSFISFIDLRDFSSVVLFSASNSNSSGDVRRYPLHCIGIAGSGILWSLINGNEWYLVVVLYYTFGNQ